MKCNIFLALIFGAFVSSVASAGIGWTASTWTYDDDGNIIREAAPSDNLISGAVPSTYTGVRNANLLSQATDGIITKIGMSDATALCMQNNASLTYKFAGPSNIRAINLYTVWGDTNRVRINVKSVTVTLPDGTVTTLCDVAHENNSSGANQRPLSILSDSNGGYLVAGAMSLTINFDVQQNGYVGCAEIEVLGETDCSGLLFITSEPEAVKTMEAGAVTPDYGALVYDSGVMERFTAPNVAFTNDYNGTGYKTEYTTRGWRIDYLNDDGTVNENKDSLTGDGSSFDYTHDGYSRLTWLFDSSHLVQFSNNGGVISCDGALLEDGDSLWRPNGTAIELAYTADSGSSQVFKEWCVTEANGTKTVYTENPLSLTIVESLHVEAVLTTAINVSEGDDIGEVLLSSSADDTIVLAPGTYTLSAELTLSGNRVLKSSSGNFNDVTLFGPTTKSRAFTIKDNARIEGITIDKQRHGAFDQGSTDANRGSCVLIDGGGTILNCRVTGGKIGRQGKGGGIYNNNGKVIGCVIDNCTAGGNIYAGLGLYQTGDDALTDRTIITNNSYTAFHSQYSGPYSTAGVFIEGGSIRNSLIAYNSVGKQTEGGNDGLCGFALYLKGTAKVENCAVVNNSVESLTGSPALAAVYRDSDTAEMINCIVAENYLLSDNTLKNFGGKKAAGYSIIQDGDDISGDGNSFGIVQEFTMDADGKINLFPTSIAVNNGCMRDWMFNAKDIYGNNRIISDKPDIGPVELIPTTTKSVTLKIDTISGFAPLSISAEALTSSITNPTYEWTANKNVVGGNSNELNYIFNEYGTYSLQVYVTEGDETISSQPVTITVSPRDVYVNEKSLTPIPPYATANTAATTIDEILPHIMSGSRIHISAGEYKITKTLQVPDDILLEGVDGRDKVVISADAECRTLVASSQNAVIRGITFKNGKTSVASEYGAVAFVGGNVLIEQCAFVAPKELTRTGRGGCLYVDGESAIVRDCVIGNIKAGHLNGGNSAIYHGLGLYLKSGLVERCTITNVFVLGAHRASDHAFGAAVEMTGGTLRSCLIAHNRVSDGAEGSGRHFAAGVYRTGGTIENCTITANKAASGCAGYYSTTADAGQCVNTIIYGNENGVIEESYNPSAVTGGDDGNLSGSAEATLFTCYTEDPKFKNRSSSPFGLKISSPCVNSGVYFDWMDTALDLKGAPRIFGKGVDIGCQERQLPAPTKIILK